MAHRSSLGLNLPSSILLRLRLVNEGGTVALTGYYDD